MSLRLHRRCRAAVLPQVLHAAVQPLQRRRHASASSGSPAKGCCGLKPAACRTSGVMSCASHWLPISVGARRPRAARRSTARAPAARLLAASVDGDLRAAGSCPSAARSAAAIVRSIELRRDWISFVREDLRRVLRGAQLAGAEPLLHVLSRWRSAVFEISPLIQRSRSSTFCDADVGHGGPHVDARLHLLAGERIVEVVHDAPRRRRLRVLDDVDDVVAEVAEAHGEAGRPARRRVARDDRVVAEDEDVRHRHPAAVRLVGEQVGLARDEVRLADVDARRGSPRSTLPSCAERLTAMFHELSACALAGEEVRRGRRAVVERDRLRLPQVERDVALVRELVAARARVDDRCLFES